MKKAFRGAGQQNTWKHVFQGLQLSHAQSTQPPVFCRLLSCVVHANALVFVPRSRLSPTQLQDADGKHSLYCYRVLCSIMNSMYTILLCIIQQCTKVKICFGLFWYIYVFVDSLFTV